MSNSLKVIGKLIRNSSDHALGGEDKEPQHKGHGYMMSCHVCKGYLEQFDELFLDCVTENDDIGTMHQRANFGQDIGHSCLDHTTENIKADMSRKLPM